MAKDITKYEKIIIDAAIPLFREYGYENVSINSICKAAGIARSTFYLTFSGKKDIISRTLANVYLERDAVFEEFICAANDFERIWMLFDRYLQIAIRFGPILSGSLFRLELLGEIDIMDNVHSVDDWVSQLLNNCQTTGVTLNRAAAERIAPLTIDIAYYTACEWCKRNGAFNLRQTVRRRLEDVCDIAPGWCMSEDKLKKL